MSEKTRRSLKSVGARLSIMYRLCKVRKDIIDNCSPFRIILSTINTHTYSLNFAEQIVEQDSEFFMGSLDVDSTSYLNRILTSAVVQFLKILREWKVYQK